MLLSKPINVHDSAQRLLDAVQGGALDLAVRYNPPQRPGIGMYSPG
ncbi:hypothetical protein [Variovorax sp. YR752]